MKPTTNPSLTEKYNRLSEFAKIFWPELSTMNEHRRLIGTGDVLSVLYTLPLGVTGLIWLIIESDLAIIQANFIFLLFNFGLLLLFSRLSFFTIVEIRADRYGSSEDSFASMIQWSAVFLFGPSALWLGVIYNILGFVLTRRSSSSQAQRWSALRTLSVSVTVNSLAFLVSITIYQLIGGVFPIAGLTLISITQAFIALGCEFVLVILVMSGYLFFHIGVQRIMANEEPVRPMIRFFLVGITLPFIAYPFSILLSGLLIEFGYGLYIFLLLGLLMVAYLARRLSQAAESSRQHSRQLVKLEKLGRDLLEAIPDTSSIPAILEKNIPGMFPSGKISIRIAPGTSLLKIPQDWKGLPDEAWDWIIDQSEPASFTVNDDLPWETETRNHSAMVISPIIRSDSGRSIGGIVVELRALPQPWNKKSLGDLFPAVQSLADYIASIIHQSQVYEHSLDFQHITRELELAGRIQASFLPTNFPSIPGWQLAVTLLPARETSGDFFDVIELGDGRLGILVADVADKGIGSALYMALSRTLIRTYAAEYEAEPEVVFFAANNRLLKDARANLFITVFYGILDYKLGELTYCNAGHNPPYLIKNDAGETIISLPPNGIAMGIESNATWTTKTIAIDPGDVMILFTDGIPDAQDEDGDFFNDEAIIKITRENFAKFAHEIQAAIIEEVQRFSGNAPQADDITLMVLMRDKDNSDVG